MDAETLKIVVEDLDRIINLTGITLLRGKYLEKIEELEEESECTNTEQR
jgi:hypothetical protein